ncbi:MAG TPA: RHS repeat-associated core domain-containing protein [Luteimonas sp.]|nr:RHS repeat-associated core domain-containing protein [Luteimonas sp.]
MEGAVGWTRDKRGKAVKIGAGSLAALCIAWGVFSAWAEDPPAGAPPSGEVLEVKGVAVIGTLAGTVSVGPSGSAHWRTDLKVVPGAGGLQPALSVSYDGNGYGGLGVGFSLSAGGAIGRCRPTLGQDGGHAPVGWTQADPLCLNGARLVAVAGAHGAAGTEYRVQNAPNVRVIAVGASTDEVSGFEVYTPDNRVTHYGLGSGVFASQAPVQWARTGGALVPFSWHIARVIDRKTQNMMLYRYAGEAVAGEDVMTPGDHRLASIGYGFNAPAGVTDVTRQVLFEYAPVQDVLGKPMPWESEAWVHQGYVAGMAYERRLVLTRVEMQVRDEGQWAFVRQYRLGYEPVPDGVADAGSPDRVRLATLKECAPTKLVAGGGDVGDKTPCFRPTRFEWSKAAAGMGPKTGFGLYGVPFYPMPPASELDTAVYDRVGMQVVGDFDGDGDEDFLVMPERMNAAENPQARWMLWRTDPQVHEPTATNIPTWFAQGPWINRAGTVVPVSEESMQLPKGAWPQNPTLADKIRFPDPARLGYRRDQKAAPGAWAMNYDGTGGTDVLVGEPVRELAGSGMDTPWGIGSKTSPERKFDSKAPDWCQSEYPNYTKADYLDCMNKYLGQSKADYTEHPGFMRGLKVLRLRSAEAGTFQETSLQLPEGQVLFYAQTLDFNGDGLTDVMFCKSDANYAAAAGQAMPMYYDSQADAMSWVSGHLYYALNAPGQGIDLSQGGYPATQDGLLKGDPIPCHAKDSYLVLDLHGDGRQSFLHRTHPHVAQITLGGLEPSVPDAVVDDPYPRDPNNAKLAGYWPKLHEKVWAETPIGESTYQAFSYETGIGLTYHATGLPYEYFMRWQHSGNRRARYSAHQRSSASDPDGGMVADGLAKRDGRLTDWGSPDALMVGGGPSEMRTGDVDGDGLTDVLMVDLQACHYGQVSNGEVMFPARGCSFQDVTEFGIELIEQTYEKLAVFVYLNRGDGTFDLGSTHRLWDTDLEPAEKQLLEKGYVAGLSGIAQDALFRSAWTKATAATRGWRMEFANSLIGDGNGDGLADLGYLRMAFAPNGGWIGDSMAGSYAMTPVWRLGRHGGGLSEAETPMGINIDKLLPSAMLAGWPGWEANYASLNHTQWEKPEQSPALLDPYAQHEYGLAARLMQMDVDRDGRDEMMIYDHVGGRWLMAEPDAADEPQPNLLAAVTDGLGARTELDYAPQSSLNSPDHPWTQADIDLPYPLWRRPRSAAAVARLRNDTGQDAGNAPLYATTHYLYGKSTVDVRHGASLGIDRHVVKSSTPTPSGMVNSLQVERYDTTPAYDATFKAYPLAGTSLGSTTMVWGEPGEAVRISHAGQRYSAHAGKAPGTWRRQLDASTATIYEVGGDAPAATAGTLFACLTQAYDGPQECGGQGESYQPLSHSATSIAYDPDNYGLPKTEIVVASGSTTVNERTFEHHDAANPNGPGGYVLGLPTLQWTAHKPKPGVAFTLRTVSNSYYSNGLLESTTVEPDQPQYRVKESYAYGPFGNLKTKTISAAGSPDNVTTYGYTSSGAYLASATNALGHTQTTRWYEGCGLPEQQTNELGQTVVRDIDQMCRDRGSQNFFGAEPLGRKTRIDYWEWDPNPNEPYPDHEVHVQTTVDGGAKTHTIANRVGQVLVSQAPGFGFEAYTQTRYDALGRARQVSLPTKVGEQPSGWTTTTYDAQGRLVRLEKPDGTIKTAQYARYLTTATDELGHSGRSEVNALGQVVKVMPPEPEDADPNQLGNQASPDLSMCYAYGAFGVLVEAKPCVPNAGKGPTTLAYDDYGRLTSSHDAQAGMRITRYDPFGRVDEAEDAQGRITKHRYDVLGRLIERIEAYGTPEAKSATWLYDTLAPGVLSQATNAEGTVVEVPILDGYQRLVGGTSTIHGRSFTRRHSYDGWGRITGRSYPTLSLLAPVQTWMQYNDLDQPIGLSWAVQLLWQPVQADVWGHTTEQSYGKYLTATSQYDPKTGRLKESQVHRKGWVTDDLYVDEPLEHFAYDWYANGLIRLRTQKALTNETDDQVDEFYYTPRGELSGWATLGANLGMKQHAMVTDGFGNITDSPSGHYTYQNERLAKIEGPLGEISYGYDNGLLNGNGNVTTRKHKGGTTVLSYDALDRVRQIKDPKANLVITYNADGAKVHVRDAYTGRETFYLGDYQEERGGVLGALVIGRYSFGPAHLTRTWTANLEYKDELSYLPPADHLGSVTLVTDATGKVKDRRSYGVWGDERDPKDWLAFKTAPQDELKLPNTGYTGTHERRQRGATAPGISGIIDMQARYYDPAAMQFLQPDSVVPDPANPLSWNRRTYVNNSPVAFSDPTGHAPQNDSGLAEDGEAFVERKAKELQEAAGGDAYLSNSGGLGTAATGVGVGALLSSMRSAILIQKLDMQPGSGTYRKIMDDAAMNEFEALSNGDYAMLWRIHYARDLIAFISGNHTNRRLSTKSFDSMDRYVHRTINNGVESVANLQGAGRPKLAAALLKRVDSIRDTSVPLRRLTENEVGFLKVFMGDSVNYGSERVGKLDSVKYGTPRGFEVGGTHIFGVILVLHYSDEITGPVKQGNIWGMKQLLHEQVHAWQDVRGFESNNLGAVGKDIYHFNLIPGKSFLSYGTEQQAAIVETYFEVTMGEAFQGRAFQWSMLTTGRQIIGNHFQQGRQPGDPNEY